MEIESPKLGFGFKIGNIIKSFKFRRIKGICKKFRKFCNFFVVTKWVLTFIVLPVSFIGIVYFLSFNPVLVTNIVPFFILLLPVIPGLLLVGTIFGIKKICKYLSKCDGLRGKICLASFLFFYYLFGCLFISLIL